MRTDFRQWYLGLSASDQERYARKAGTSSRYIRIHLISRRKIPRKDLLEKLAAASEGKFTVRDLLDFFYETGRASSRRDHRPAA